MAYRLYNSDVEKGLITDTNVERFFVLKEVVVQNVSYALIFNPTSLLNPFIVAIDLRVEKLNSIHWMSGRYFSDIVAGVLVLHETVGQVCLGF